MNDLITASYCLILLCIGWVDYQNRKHLLKRLNLAEEMIHDLANQYMILLHVRREGNVIELRPEMVIKEKLH